MRSSVRRRALLAGLLVLVVLVVGGLGLGGAGWYYADRLLRVTHAPDPLDLTVTAAEAGSVTLSRTPDSARPGSYGLAWAGGHALVGPVTAESGRTVTRLLTQASGPIAAGTRARMQTTVYLGDPRSALNLSYREVDVPGPLGPLPSWQLPGRRSTWVLLVHGLGSSRAEGLRVMPTLVSLGFPVLDISYRNDVVAPPSPDGLYHLGDTEWHDLEAAVRYAMAQGAGAVVLYGWSMGGAIVSAYLHDAADRGQVRAAVLDAPVLDWRRTLALQAADRHLPRPLTLVAEQVVSRRIHLDFDGYDQIARAGELHTPILLFHGTDDRSVPVAGSDAFARARPDLVSYHRVAQAGHTQAYNVDPAGYTSALTAFLDRAAP